MVNVSEVYYYVFLLIFLASCIYRTSKINHLKFMLLRKGTNTFRAAYTEYLFQRMLQYRRKYLEHKMSTYKCDIF